MVDELEASVELVQVERPGGQPLEELQAQPGGRGDRQFSVEIGPPALAGARGDIQIGGEIEVDEIARAIIGGARLQHIVKAQPQDVRPVQAVDISHVAEFDGLKVRGKHLPVDRRDISLATLGLGDVAVGKPGG